jgi:hypothetical protein
MAAFTIRPFLVVDHLLEQRVAEGLQHPALHLAAGGDRVDGHPAVDGHDELHHGDLPGVDVHLDLGQLGGERRRRLGRHERRRAHDLLLVLGVQRVQRHVLEADRAAVGRPGLAVTQDDRAGLRPRRAASPLAA